MKNNLIKETNNYLANVGVMYIKLHNLHWNVVGVQFKAVHEYLEGIYDFFADTLDEVAEYIKMENEFPLANLKDYLNVSTIKELESKNYSIKGALDILLSDIKTLKEQAQTLRENANEYDVFSLVNILEDHISEYNKIIWFVESMLK